MTPFISKCLLLASLFAVALADETLKDGRLGKLEISIHDGHFPTGMYGNVTEDWIVHININVNGAYRTATQDQWSRTGQFAWNQYFKLDDIHRVSGLSFQLANRNGWSPEKLPTREYRLEDWYPTDEDDGPFPQKSVTVHFGAEDRSLNIIINWTPY